MLWLGKELACGSGRLQSGGARREAKETRDAGPNTSSWFALIFLNNIFYD
jgi:hypothetical protein